MSKQVTEVLVEEMDYAGFDFRIWFVDTSAARSAQTLISVALQGIRDVEELAKSIAFGTGVSAVQVRRAGHKVSALVYNDWP